jgi:hypothetical protein
MGRPLTKRVIGRTPTANNTNVLLIYGNVQGTVGWYDILKQVGSNKFFVRSWAETSPKITGIITLTNGVTTNPGNGYIHFMYPNNSDGYAARINNHTLRDFKNGEFPWHMEFYGDNHVGVYVDSNWYYQN